MSDLMIKWRDRESGQWRDYAGMDLLGMMTLENVCHQFDSGLDVVAREGNRYIVSSDSLAASYAKKRADVTTFRALLAAGGDHLQQEFRRVGFFGQKGVGNVVG